MKFFKEHKKIKILAVILLAIILMVVGVCAFLLRQIYKDSVAVKEPEDVDPTASQVAIAREEIQDEEVFNVLLVGTDSRDPNTDMGRSDSIMLVSYNAKEKKATLASFLRDSLVEIDGYGKSRLGHTYAYGGVGLTINTINKVYGLDIQNYITISFDNLVNVIDNLGGIEVPFTAEEAEYYRANGMPDAQEGINLLTGTQALSHARNRSLDNDFGRTRRQRSVLNGIYRKVMQEKDPAAVLSLINFCMTQVKTNMAIADIYDMAEKVLAEENLKVQQISVPAEGTYQFADYEGMAVLEINIEENKKNIQDYLY
ncbi:LCP family protein [Dorea acetigenes]|uniref:LCP family protein n=1 Tax=Dorea acetigenes TaxID=2981787 RepID=A0ABT2RND7_9FIRM|nr:LCP family protein [Dorea acetigenes]MCB6415207.1 LCP family protein [Faecalimonas umbilicata]MCU6686905.1 LCP family protein [Dorea acetigenes]SCJ17393.1 Putative transcriptional regulator ywtF [uncultured Clostridium sp.]